MVEDIEKLFKNIGIVNHSKSNSYNKMLIRIKDSAFSVKSIVKIIEHINWMKSMKLCNRKLKIIIDSEIVEDEATIMLFETIVYYFIKKYNNIISYRSSFLQNKLSFELFKNSMLYKYNGINVSPESFVKEYEKYQTINENHMRILCDKNIANTDRLYLSEKFTDISYFIRNLIGDEEYANDLAEVIIEILGNFLEHSNGTCIMNINILSSTQQKFNYIDVATLNIDDVHFGNGIIEYMKDTDNKEYTLNNKIILDAFETHKNYFDQEYTIEEFAMVSAFQKKVSTRKKTNYTGGTGLTKLIQALIDKSNAHYCYAFSGKTTIFFIKDFLKLTEEGYIGFNSNNDYFNSIPDKKAVKRQSFNLNSNIYNLQFIVKENE